MALEHALLVALRERPGTGIELARRFDRSIGFFWQATHQQIYVVLRRMEADGWVSASAGGGRSTEKRYAVTPAGDEVLAAWVDSRTDPTRLRSEVAVKMRGASYGDRRRLLAHLTDLRAEHRLRLLHFEQLEREQFPDPTALSDRALDAWLVLRGGIRQERFWDEWLTEYLEAWAQRPTDRSATEPTRSDTTQETPR